MKIKQNLSIDESILPFKGNWKNPSFTPLKAHKRGMKFYCLNDSSTGYCFKLQICSHKSTIIETVDKLLEGFTGHWNILYTDNFYTSTELAEKLHKDQIYLIGTIRYNRGGPKDLKNIGDSMKKGDTRIFLKNNLMIILWYDKKLVKIISNYNDSDFTLAKINFKNN